MQDALDVVVTLRSKFLNEHNQYIFGLVNGLGHIRGHDCLRQYSEECGAAKPETLRSTKMRKQFATKCQLLNLPNNMLNNVARFMGHNLAVHKKYYQVPMDVTQVTKVSKILMAIENGSIKTVAGKSLDEIDEQDLDVAESQCEGIIIYLF